MKLVSINGTTLLEMMELRLGHVRRRQWDGSMEWHQTTAGPPEVGCGYCEADSCQGASQLAGCIVVASNTHPESSLLLNFATSVNKRTLLRRQTIELQDYEFGKWQSPGIHGRVWGCCRQSVELPLTGMVTRSSICRYLQDGTRQNRRNSPTINAPLRLAHLLPFFPLIIKSSTPS